MKRYHRIDEADIHAFIDGELTDGRRAAVERYLAARPGEAERVEAYRQQAAQLRRALAIAPYDPRLDEFRFMEERLSRRLRSARLVRGARAAAAAVLFLAAGWGAHLYVSGSDTPPFVSEAAAAYSIFSGDLVHPVEVTAIDSGHLIQWLSERVGVPFNIPDLHEQGYHLIGGRLVPNDTVPAGLLMYEDDAHHRFSVFVTRLPRGSGTSRGFGARGKVYVGYWARDGIGYVVSTNDPAEVIRLADAVDRQMPQVPFGAAAGGAPQDRSGPPR